MFIRCNVFFLSLLMWLPPGSALSGDKLDLNSKPERRLALVVGNWAYEVGPLRNPKFDAEAMAEALSGIGFEVMHRQNLTRSSFRKAIRRFGDKLFNYDVGLFFYAGHAMQVSGKNYLLPVGVDIEVENEVQDEAVDAGLVLRKMKSASNFINIVILDACRNNPFARSFRSSSLGLARMDAPKGTLITYSTAPGAVAADGAGNHSPFTKHLLANISTPGLPIEKVFKQVRVGLSLETRGRQISWGSSSLMGDFYFVAPTEFPKKAHSLSGVLTLKNYFDFTDFFIDGTKLEQVDFDLIELLPGWHTVKVTDNKGATRNLPVFITAGDVKEIDLNTSFKPASSYRNPQRNKSRAKFLPPP